MIQYKEEIQSMKHKCNNCLYGETCKEIAPCKDFYPINEDIMPDDMVEKIIETGRSEYTLAWNEYIREFSH